VRKFQEEDDIQDTKQRLEQNLKSGAEELKSNLQKPSVQNVASSFDLKTQAQEASKPVGYDSKYKVNPLIPVFSRRREVFIGRLAILGIVAAGFWEYALPNHPNILLQISGALNLANIPAGPGVSLVLIGFIVAYNALEGLAPGSPTFSQENQRDVARRPPGPPNDQFNGINQLLGITGWGFSKANEVFNGRAAMIGFAAAILQQLRLGGLYGPGPIAQVATFLGIPTDSAFWGSVPTYFWGFTIFAVAFSYLRGNTGDKTRFGEDEIY
jgi:hypothetical protein